MNRSPRALLPLLLLLLATTACKTVVRVTDPSYVGPFRTQFNHANRMSPDGPALRRVAVLPVVGREDGGGGDLAAGAEMLQPLVLEELRQSRAFEVVGFQPPTGSRIQGPGGLRVTDPLPTPLLSEIQSTTAAQAVMFTQVTGYQAYPPLLLGLKLTLVSLPEGRILWEFDDVFNAGDPPTLNAARRYLRERLSVETERVEGITLDSPRRFARYALSVIFGTLSTAPAQKIILNLDTKSSKDTH